MAAQPQIIITTPGNVQGATVFSAPLVAQANMANQQSMLTEKEKDELRFFTRLKTGLYVIGSVSIVLGCGVLAAGIVALALGSFIELGFTFVWAGFAFAIINGGVALKGAKMQPHMDKHWCRVLLGIGSTALVLHFIDLIIACISAGVYDVEYTRKQPCSSSYCYSYFYYMVTPTSSEAPRIVMLVTLLAMDICQLVAVSKCLNRYLNACPATANTMIIAAAAQPMTVIQTNSAIPGTSYVVVPTAQISAPQPAMYFQPPAPMPQPAAMPPQTKYAEANEPPPYQPNY